MGRIKSSKGPDIKKKGKPSGVGVNRAGLKSAKINQLEKVQELSEKYTKGEDIPAENIPQRHPNRNLDKPDIDKPPYS
jgi:hypothetical protein